MLVWGSGGKGVCGVDFYNEAGKRLSFVSPLEYGSTGNWLIVKTRDGIYAIPQSEEGYSAGQPLTKQALQDFLSEHQLLMPKMKRT